MNILVCTPGRLLQHMDETPEFDGSNVQTLVLDEADRCMDLGFSACMDAIIENLPRTRHTMLFSATQSKKCAAKTPSTFVLIQTHPRQGRGAGYERSQWCNCSSK